MSAILIQSTLKPLPRELSPARRALLRLMRRRGAMLGLAIVLIFVLIAVFAPLIAPQDPLQTSWSAVRKAPSAQYLLVPMKSGVTCCPG